MHQALGNPTTLNPETQTARLPGETAESPEKHSDLEPSDAPQAPVSVAHRANEARARVYGIGGQGEFC